jgi:hypothetical protein
MPGEALDRQGAAGDPGAARARMSGVGRFAQAGTRTRRFARSRRARLALGAVALWLVGVEVLPAVHQGLHDALAPHRHDAGALVMVSVSFEDTTHRHPDGSIHFVAARAPGARPARHHHHRHAPDDARPRARDASHHRHAPDDARPRARDASHHPDGLAHHAAALAPHAPPVTRPLPIDRRPRTVAIARVIAPVLLDPLAATARGPPRAS